MKKIERLEQENKILRDMLSDIQESVQKFEEDTATGEGYILNAFKTLGSIAYVAGSFPSRMDEQRSLTVRKAPWGGRHESTSDNCLPGSCSICWWGRKPERKAAAGSHRDYDCVPGGAADSL